MYVCVHCDSLILGILYLISVKHTPLSRGEGGRATLQTPERSEGAETHRARFGSAHRGARGLPRSAIYHVKYQCTPPARAAAARRPARPARATSSSSGAAQQATWRRAGLASFSPLI